MITAKGLTKYYGERCAIDDVSFSITKGEVVGFLGPNGAGKSTTMKIITGYMPPTKGEVRIGNLSVEEDAFEIRKRIGYLPEHNPLYLDFTVEEFLLAVMDIRHIAKHKKRDALTRAVDICGLKEVFFRPIGTLSKGYRQRVGLAQALIHEPDILILDEPTSGLDPKQIIEIRDLITHIGKSHTVLLSTHILQEVKAMCSRVLMINRGKIVASDTIENLEAHAGGRGILHTVIKGAEGKVKHGLEGLKGVVEVKEKKGEAKEHGVHSYLITVEKAGDVREELFDLAVKEGWKILESTQKKVELEDVFLELTR